MKKENSEPKTININRGLTKNTHTNKDLMQNLKKHLQYIEDKHDLNARTSLLTSLFSALVGTACLGGTGIGYLASQSGINVENLAEFASVSGLSLGASVVFGIIARNQYNKKAKFKYFRQLSEAGLEDSTKLEQTKKIIQNEGTLDDIKNEIMPKQDKRIGFYDKNTEADLVEFESHKDEDQLGFDSF